MNSLGTDTNGLVSLMGIPLNCFLCSLINTLQNSIGTKFWFRLPYSKFRRPKIIIWTLYTTGHISLPISCYNPCQDCVSLQNKIAEISTPQFGFFSPTQFLWLNVHPGLKVIKILLYLIAGLFNENILPFWWSWTRQAL